MIDELLKVEQKKRAAKSEETQRECSERGEREREGESERDETFARVTVTETEERGRETQKN